MDTCRGNGGEAFRRWRDDISVIFDVKCDKGPEEEFHLQMDVFRLADILLASGIVSAQSYERSRWKAGRDGVDHYLLQFYLDGAVTRRDGCGDSHGTRSGDLWVSDLAQPLSSRATASRFLNLFIPRRLLCPLLLRPDEHSMRIHPGHSPLVALLLDHVRALHERAPDMNIDEASQIVRPTLELAAAALNGGASPNDGANAGVNDALCDAICRHARSHMSDPELRAARVAATFGISRRKLDHLFAPLGGFADWMRKERLASARRMLCDPTRDRLTIDEIARIHGFRYQANFTCAFRKLYHMTPMQTRGLFQEQMTARDRERPSTRSEWARWIEAL